MQKVERVKRAINFTGPDRIPLLLYNTDLEKSDIIVIEVVNQFGSSESPQSEWGFVWQKLDRTMGQPAEPLIRDWADRKNLLVPAAKKTGRFATAAKMMAEYPGAYYLASLGLSGFAVMSSIRGFADCLTDIYLETE
ncbi:MAG: hypothetical protein SCM11_11485, partial [Bacillota bacterium]|nr:hypothetical protein [Bacillota bacterium]